MLKKIGLIDADLLDNGTRHPNLALMKISGYFKEEGHSTSLIFRDLNEINYYDEIYISKVFSYTKIEGSILKLPNVHIGGTGFFEDGGENLPEHIEHHMPDYNLYKEYIDYKISLGKKRNCFSDYLDYSIGFITRGCFRKCEFCVNKKYDKAFLHSHISEFLDESRKAIYLWDDNFFAYSGWEEILDEIEKTNKPFQFRQGIDIRLLTARKAERLSKTKYQGDFIFAFDHIKDKKLIVQKLELWRRYTSKTTKLYVLCGYDSQDHKDIENTLERIKVLMQHGCLPYIMRHDRYLDSAYRGLYVQLARWCNQPQFFKKKSFREFCIANQEYHANKKTNCAAYQAMIDFELQYPEIAKEYFDLKFDELNKYKISFGFGRKYANKISCEVCEREQRTWINAYNGLISEHDVLGRYFTQEMDLQCLAHDSAICIEPKATSIASWFCTLLKGYSVDEIWMMIKNEEPDLRITQANIPKFSDFKDGTLRTVDVVRNFKEGIAYDTLGGYYTKVKTKNAVARRKYGENHAKLAALLDLTTINIVSQSAVVFPSVLSKAFVLLSDKDKEEISIKLLLRIPIIQALLNDSFDQDIVISDYMKVLSEKTILRRLPNILTIIDKIELYSEERLSKSIKNLKRV